VTPRLKTETPFQMTRLPIENGIWGINYQNYQMVTLPMTSPDMERSNKVSNKSDLNILKVQYIENSWKCYLGTIANY